MILIWQLDSMVTPIAVLKIAKASGFSENYQGEVFIRVSLSTTLEEPTHVVNLYGAKNIKRLTDI